MPGVTFGAVLFQNQVMDTLRENDAITLSRSRQKSYMDIIFLRLMAVETDSNVIVSYVTSRVPNDIIAMWCLKCLLKFLSPQ